MLPIDIVLEDVYQQEKWAVWWRRGAEPQARCPRGSADAWVVTAVSSGHQKAALLNPILQALSLLNYIMYHVFVQILNFRITLTQALSL